MLVSNVTFSCSFTKRLSDCCVSSPSYVYSVFIRFHHTTIVRWLSNLIHVQSNLYLFLDDGDNCNLGIQNSASRARIFAFWRMFLARHYSLNYYFYCCEYRICGYVTCLVVLSCSHHFSTSCFCHEHRVHNIV